MAAAGAAAGGVAARGGAPEQANLDQRCGAPCRYCGRHVSLVCRINGFGVLRRRHERRCFEEQLAARSDVTFRLPPPRLTSLPLSCGSGEGDSLRTTSFPRSSPVPVSAGSSEIVTSGDHADAPFLTPMGSLEDMALRSLPGDVEGADDSPTQALDFSSVPPSVSSSPRTPWRGYADTPSDSPRSSAGWRAAPPWPRAPAPTRADTPADSFGSARPRGEGSAEAQRRAPSPLAALGAALQRAAAAERSAPRAARLAREGRVAQALSSARSAGVLWAKSEQDDALEVRWLRQIAPRFDGFSERLRWPPAGGGWSGPYEYRQEGDVHMELWYAWTAQGTLTTMSRTTLRGTMEQGLALLHEADLQHNWLPCLKECIADWSDSVPALVVDLRAQIPGIFAFSTMVHRVFVEHTADDGGRGVAILDWTPEEAHVADGRFCGMRVPDAGRMRRVPVQRSSTVLMPEGNGKFSMVLRVEQKFPKLPDFAVRTVFKMQGKVCARKMLGCIDDFEGRGYAQRVRDDQRGIYARMHRMMAEEGH